MNTLFHAERMDSAIVYKPYQSMVIIALRAPTCTGSSGVVARFRGVPSSAELVNLTIFSLAIQLHAVPVGVFIAEIWSFEAET